MNVLDRLKLDVVNCADFALDRPYAKADSVGASLLYLNPDDDPIVQLDLVDEAIGRGYLVGLRFNCAISEDPVTFANSRSGTVETLGGKTKIASVMFDVELDKRRPAQERLAWQAAFLDRWDQIRSGRPTLYNVAPFQDATQNDYTRMLRRNLLTGQLVRKIGVQTYLGPTMTPLKRMRDAIDYLFNRFVGPLDFLEPVLDPAHALQALGGFDAGTRGATLYEAGRIP